MTGGIAVVGGGIRLIGGVLLMAAAICFIAACGSIAVLWHADYRNRDIDDVDHFNGATRA